jgi:Flp pilus assembly protein TadD
MTRSLHLILAVLLVFSTGLAVVAQDDATTFTFDSGVQFTLPEDSVLDDSGMIPTVTVDDAMLIELIDPAILGDTPDATLDAPLAGVLDFLLGAVGYEEERSDDATFTITLDDGREAMAYDFINASDVYTTLLVVRLSDGRVAALNIRSLESLTDAQRGTVLALAASFDMGGEAALTAGLPQEHAYESGVSFRYPEDYLVEDPASELISIGLVDEIIISMVDPHIVGMPAGEPMDAIIDFALRQFPLEKDSFEPFDIGGREAVIGSREVDQFVQTLVMVRFDDDTVGIMDIATPGEISDELLAQVRSIAASFNSASAEFTGVSREDFERSRELFEEAQVARDADEMDNAAELFSQAIALDETYGLAFYWRAITNRDLGQFEDALADFQQALTLEPDEAQIRSNIGEMHAILGDVDAALAEMEAFIAEAGPDALNENDQWAYDVYQRIAAGEYVAEFYTSRSNRLRAAGRYEAALADIETALENDPDDPTLYARYGVIYTEMRCRCCSTTAPTPIRTTFRTT